MRPFLSLCVTASVLGAVLAVAGPGAKHRLSVAEGPATAADKLPPMLPVIRQAILAEAAGATIDDCQRTTEDGEFVFEVEITRNGVERSFSVALDGSIRSRQHLLAELPVPVQQTIAALKEHGEPGQLFWCDEGGDLVYEVELGSGAEKRFYTIAPDGTHLATQRQFAELPQVAQKIIREQAGADLIASVSRDETEAGVVFDAVLVREGRRRVVSVNAAGVVVANQILSVQTPIAVQAQLPKLLGGAKMIYLGECTEDGTTVYAVIAMRGAQREEFVVDAEGKLIARVVPPASLPEPAQKYLRAQAAGARIARVEKLADETFSADLDRNGKKQVITFTAAGTAR